jgi:glycosyltransferase involved in cell wall biosynthesis
MSQRAGGEAHRSAVRCAIVSAPFSGIDVWLRNLVAMMADRDDVEIVSSTWMTPPPEVQLGRLPPLRLHWWVSAWWSTVRGLRAMRRRGATADVVVVNHLSPLVMAGTTSRRTPIVLNLDATPRLTSTMAEHYLGRGARPWRVERLKIPMYRFSYRRAAHIVAWSEMVRRSLVDDYGVDESRVSVIPNGIDIAAWQPPTRASDDEPRVLFVGGEFHRKGGRDLVAVASSNDMAGVRFDVVTKSKRIGETPANVVVHRDLDAASDGLQDLYRRASVFVLPTYADFSPNVLCEAMAMGLPTISTTVGAIGDIVTDGRTGFLVPPGDTDALRARLRELLTDPDLRARMGRQARTDVERRFDIRQNVDDFVAVLHETRRRGGVTRDAADPH